MICVLLSTYNGARYLDIQLRTIIEQKCKIKYILIRDDGSCDETLNIIRRYKREYNIIKVIEGKNIGVKNSFFELLNMAPISDYYAFCDQDDIWDDDKMEVALDKMKNLPQNEPNVYFSNVRLVNEKGVYMCDWHKSDMSNQNKYASLLENKATGATMVFNRAALQLVKDKCYTGVKFHDWWMYLIGKFFGNVIYDHETHMSYRQHGGNVVGANKKKFLKRVINFMLDDSCPRLENAKAFYREYKNNLNDNEMEKIQNLLQYQDNIIKKTKLLTDREFFCDSISVNVKDMLLVLCNKL